MQAIIAKYHGPSNTRGARIIAKCPQGSITIPYPHELSGEEVYRKAAQQLIDKLNWHHRGAWHCGFLEQGSYVFVCVEHSIK